MTLAATLPPAILLYAVADWTVEGRIPRKRKPSASVGGSSGAVAACAPSPRSAMKPKQKTSAPPCNFQLRMPCRTSRSEEHTSELQSLMRISYAVFCLKKKTYKHNT